MCGQKMNKTGILSEIEANAFAFAFFEVMFVVLYDKNNAFAQIEKNKKNGKQILWQSLFSACREFDIRAKGVDVLQAEVPFQALRSVKSS